MDTLDLLVDLHADGARQGPGGDEQTRLAIALGGLRDASPPLRIADVGCGTGASTLVLARELDSDIVAVDLFPQFLQRLESRARSEGLADRIELCPASMDALPLPNASLDALWAEGSIYNMGFEHGVRSWRRFLAPGGVLAVTELTWFTEQRPAELRRHWEREYPEVGSASAKMAVLETNGFSPLGYFPLPNRCWLDNYYGPMRARFAEFLARHHHSGEAKAVVHAEQEEIGLFERHSAHFGYGFYVARKTGDRPGPGLPNR